MVTHVNIPGIFEQEDAQMKANSWTTRYIQINGPRQIRKGSCHLTLESTTTQFPLPRIPPAPLAQSRKPSVRVTELRIPTTVDHDWLGLAVPVALFEVLLADVLENCRTYALLAACLGACSVEETHGI